MRRLGLLLLLVLTSACGGDDDAVHIYTSIYPQVIERMKPLLAEAFPGVAFRWNQMGSEQIAAQLNAELAAGETRCDLLMTSDPFYYLELAEAGHLAVHRSAAARGVAAGLEDPQHRFTTVRVPLMVLAVNRERLGAAAPPSSFRDLADARFAGKVSMGDPLKSGTSFTTVAALVQRYGWSFIEDLRKNDLLAAGGNSATLHRLETGERPVAVILLENLLPALERGAPLEVVYPSDGAVPVPSPVAILNTSDDLELARRVYDFLFSATMQAAVVSGYMYSPLPEQAPPAGARPWSELALHTWDADALARVRAEREDIKKRFRAIMR